MMGPTRASVSRIAAASLLCLALALAAPAGAGAEAAVHYTRESIQAYEGQLSGGEIAAATINKRVGSVRLTLKNGQHYLIHYKAHEEPAVAAALGAKNVPVTVLKASEAQKEASKAPVKHKLRYIAGGILVVVVIVVGAVLLVDRRRKRLAE
jgi:hypothetical protein